MFDYMEFQTFGPAEIVDFYTTSSPTCMLQEQDQDLADFFPELIESDWQEHRCSQCECKMMLWCKIFKRINIKKTLPPDWFFKYYVSDKIFIMFSYTTYVGFTSTFRPTKYFQIQ